MSHPNERQLDPPHDATTTAVVASRGSVREVIVLAIPVVLTHISITAMQIVDSVMVGQLGSPQLAASALVASGCGR